MVNLNSLPSEFWFCSTVSGSIGATLLQGTGIVVTATGGALFGLVQGVTFTLLRPVAERLFGKFFDPNNSVINQAAIVAFMFLGSMLCGHLALALMGETLSFEGLLLLQGASIVSMAFSLSLSVVFGVAISNILDRCCPRQVP